MPLVFKGRIALIDNKDIDTAQHYADMISDQLGVLREAVNKRDGGVPEEQQPFAGIGMGHIGKLVGSRLIRRHFKKAGVL